jgi:hypothetical protein
MKRRTQNNGFNKSKSLHSLASANKKKFSLVDAMECKGLRDMIRTFDTLRGNLDLEDELVAISCSEFNLRIKEQKHNLLVTPPTIELDTLTLDGDDEADNLTLDEEELDFYSDYSSVHIPRIPTCCYLIES